MIVSFPIQGLHRGLPAEGQPEATSFDLSNVRPFDTESERIRGGQRPGLKKAYDTQISDASHPVLYLVSCVTTYIEPV
jgi:hypothetical protein